MRSLTVALAAVLAVAALAFAAIETEEVSLESIKGEPWDLDFTFRMPQRIVVKGDEGQAEAYWFMLYTVTNNTGEARVFVPQATLFTNNGKVAYDVIRPDVQEAVKQQYRLAELKNSVQMMGDANEKAEEGQELKIKPSLKAGAEEAQDGIFIFREVDMQMDGFKVFVTGLSGRFVVRTVPATAEGEQPEEVVLRKTMELDFSVPGDSVRISEDKVYLLKQKWIWR
ncbi:MAG: hypothetical protein GXY74_05655 [Phycisphaerae bacterium]|nr:hypothetical protein [Phycisphaerae bacterium]